MERQRTKLTLGYDEMYLNVNETGNKELGDNPEIKAEEKIFTCLKIKYLLCIFSNNKIKRSQYEGLLEDNNILYIWNCDFYV